MSTPPSSLADIVSDETSVPSTVTFVDFLLAIRREEEVPRPVTLKRRAGVDLYLAITSLSMASHSCGSKRMAEALI